MLFRFVDIGGIANHHYLNFFLIINRRFKLCTYSRPLTKTTCYHNMNDNINMNSTIARSMNASN